MTAILFCLGVEEVRTMEEPEKGEEEIRVGKEYYSHKIDIFQGQSPWCFQVVVFEPRLYSLVTTMYS